MKAFYKIFSLFFLFCFLGISSFSYAHSVQVAYCVNCNGDLRLYVEHWHSSEDPNTTSMTIELSVGGVVTSQTGVPSGALMDVPFGGLPGCATPATVFGSCAGSANTYNDWVYYDFPSVPSGVPITIKVISGSSVFTEDGCGMYPAQTVQFTIPVNVAPTFPNQSVCGGQSFASTVFDNPTGTTWTNSNPAIGLPASGSGNVPAFVANTSLTTQTGTITVATQCYTTTFVMTVNPSPNPNFTFPVTANNSFCRGSTVPFTITNTSNINTTSWTFGDGGTSSIQNPSHTYSVNGTYVVQLNITPSVGTCTGTSTQTLTIYTPTANFTSTNNCLNSTTNFTSTSLSPATFTSQVWSYGDGSPNSTMPSHTYSVIGNYTVGLIVTDSNACKDSINLAITISPNPVVAISANTVCLNVATSFINTSSVTAPDNIATWAWDFDNNGTIDNGTQTPTNTFTAAGNYTVELKVITNNGCSDSLTLAVKVNVLPTATFTPVNACLNTNVVLNNTSSITAPDNITAYGWNFGVGAIPATASIANPTPAYTTSGIKNITLNLTANTTCTATITQTVEIYPQPVANFSTTSVCQSTATAFTDLSTPTGSMTAWLWDFTNNGSVDNMTNAPTNIYPTSGTFSASLIVTDNNSCKDTVVLPLNVWGHSIPDFTPTTVCFNTATTFTNLTNTTTNINVGGVPTWVWNFGDGSPASATQDPLYTYTTIGVSIYNVTLTATTTNNCIDYIVKTVTVNVLPTATFTAVNACMNSNVVLNNTSNIPAPDNLSSYFWDFGTGSVPTGTSNVQNPLLLTYNTSGIKTITLTITANTSCTASITNTVDIYPQPVANFSTTSVCQSTATAFTDLSTPTGSIIAWAWDFTNNTSVDNTTNAPTNIYPTSGTFTTSLIVTSSNNCQDTVVLPLNVWGHTIPNFTPDKVCFGTASLFTNLTDETTNENVGSGTTYVWDFADGSATTTIKNPSHTYTLGGNANAIYNVTLTATSFNNCIDDIIKIVNVYALPTASFTSDSVCLGLSSQMTDASNGNGNVVNTYAWDFLSDGSMDISGVPNPNFIFPSIGNNSVTYTVSTSPVVGLVCNNATNTITVWVNPNPIPDFTFVNKCINAQPNTFDGSTSTIAIGTNVAYTWTYGDGVVSPPTFVPTITHAYLAAGVCNATLTVTSNKGCQTAVAKQVEVYQKPIMNFINSSPCDKTAMTFTAISLPNSGVVSQWYWDFNNSISTIEGNGQTSNFIFSGPGTQTVALVSETTIGGCRDTMIKTVYVNYVPVPLFTVDKPNGCPIHCVNFTDATLPIIGPAQITQWQWTLGDGTVVTNGTNSNVNHCYLNSSSSQLAQYDVNLVVTTDSGCVNSINKLNYITVYPKPIANYFVDPNPGNVITPLEYFTNQSQDYTKWWWIFGDNSPNDSVNVDPTHFYDAVTAGTYYSLLLIANQYGCMDTAYVPVEIGPEFTFYIPNAFSPLNKDGINDYFNGMGIGIAEYEMWIFDRWGEKIFYTDDLEKGWDGIVQGKSEVGKQDVYIWKVKLKDVLGKKHDYIGHVTLLNK